MKSSSGLAPLGDPLFSSDKTARIASFLIIGLAFLAYANILNNALFLDDLDFIINNSYLRDWRYFSKLFTEPMTAGAGKTGDYYRPMMQVFFLAGYSIWGPNPMGYHLMSILCHAANAWLFYRILLRICGAPLLALAAALLFAVHPAQTESVASASALGILLGCFFGFSAILLHWKAQSQPLPPARAKTVLFLSLAANACALLSKETMVVLPGLLFLIFFCFADSHLPIRPRLRKSLLAAMPHLAIAGLYVLLRFTVLDFGGTGNLFRAENLFTTSWTARLFTFLHAFRDMIGIALWPATLHMERSTLIPVYLTPVAAPVLQGALLLAGMVAAGLWTLLKGSASGSPAGRAMIAAGFFWFLFCMVPVSNVFIPISATIVESWLYMPIAGILTSLTGVLHCWLTREDFAGPRTAASLVVFAILLGLGLGKTLRQNRVWRDPITFYEHNLAYAPESARFHNNLAMAYSDQKRPADAIIQYREAIRISDEYPETHHNLALLYQEAGNGAAAEREFHRAIEMNPRFHYSYGSLASLYMQAKRPDMAQRVLEALVKNAPDRWEGYYNLGIVLSIQGNHPAARALWQKGLEIDPYNKNLREILEKN